MKYPFVFFLCLLFNFVQSHGGVFDTSEDIINPNSFKTIWRKQDSYKYVVVYRGYCFSSSGYGQESRAYIKGFLSLGVPIVVEAQEEVDVVPSITERDNQILKSLQIVIALSHMSPDVASKAEWADYNIVRSMWEMPEMPSQWVQNLLAFDEIWVTGNFNKLSFASSGIPENRLFVVGECVDEEYYTDTAIHGSVSLQFPQKRKVNFVSVFNWNYRKGWDVLVEAFASEFSQDEDVTLFIKTFSSWGKKKEYFEKEIERILKEKKIIKERKPDNIVLLTQGFSEGDMPLFYKSFDAFVLPTRAEGWGRTTMEAMMCGVPVVTTKYSGQEEFINSKNSFIIPHKIVPVSSEAAEEFSAYTGGKWAEPSVTDLRKIMRKISKHTKDIKKKAKFGQEFIVSHFSSFLVVSRMRERMDQIVSHIIK